MLKNLVFRPLGVLAFPLFQFLFLRFFCRDFLGLRIGYPGMTDYDFVLPCLIAFAVFFYVLDREKKVVFSFQFRATLLNGALFLVFLMGCFFYLHLISLLGEGYFWIWTALAIATIFSGLFLMVSPRYFWTHPNRWMVLPAVFIGLSKILGRHVFDVWWKPAAEWTAKAAFAILSFFSAAFELRLNQVFGGELWQVISHPGHQVAIGLGCSGLEGIFFFLTTGVLLLMVFGKQFRSSDRVLFLALGSIGMFWLNIVRIVLIDAAGIFLTRWTTPETAAQIVAVFVHNGAGWLLYAGFLIAYVKAWGYLLVRRPSLKTEVVYGV